METAFQSLRRHYIQSAESLDTQKREQIESAKVSLNRIFGALFRSLTLRKRVLMEQLEAMAPSDDGKQCDRMASCKEDIERLKAFLRRNQAEYDELLQSESDPKERKRRILQIGRSLNGVDSDMFGDVQRKMAELESVVRARYSSRWNIEVASYQNIESAGSMRYELQRSFVYEADGDR